VSDCDSRNRLSEDRGNIFGWNREANIVDERKRTDVLSNGRGDGLVVPLDLWKSHEGLQAEDVE
jgi:hypothetical protein